MKEDILLHSCCGPCASASVERLLSQGRNPMLYYSNSNINSSEEFDKRLFELEKVAHHFSVPFMADPWIHQSWLKKISGTEDQPEGQQRCRLCFRFNLQLTVKQARDLLLPFISTLSICPYIS
ncbi:MAG: epoxyqueuosine reductase QueH, partial [Spirochaetaceae bacterium]|nr:epoxyqueuosine reductase QueH [Spirochaetaceae bacterium]